MRFSAVMLGVGIYGALLSGHSEQLLHDSLSAQGSQWLEHTQAVASRVVAGDMPAALELLPQDARPVVEPLAHHAFVGGFSLLLWVAGLAGLVAALVVGTLMRHPIPAINSHRPTASVA